MTITTRNGNQCPMATSSNKIIREVNIVYLLLSSAILSDLNVIHHLIHQQLHQVLCQPHYSCTTGKKWGYKEIKGPPYVYTQPVYNRVCLLTHVSDYMMWKNWSHFVKYTHFHQSVTLFLKNLHHLEITTLPKCLWTTYIESDLEIAH